MNFTNQDDKILNLNGVNFEISLLVEIFPIDNAPTRRKLLTVEKEIGRVPTQRTLLQAPTPRFTQPEQENDIDDTHPIENTTELEHKGNRIILDQLLETMI